MVIFYSVRKNYEGFLKVDVNPFFLARRVGRFSTPGKKVHTLQRIIYTHLCRTLHTDGYGQQLNLHTKWFIQYTLYKLQKQVIDSEIVSIRTCYN